MLCLGTKGQTILEHLEALEPADVCFGANCDSTKTEEYHDFRGYAVNCTE
jgi:hypothetical protein